MSEQADNARQLARMNNWMNTASNAEQLVVESRQNYRDLGRGFWYIDLRIGQAGYIPATSIDKLPGGRARWSGEAEQVRTYDPTKELVVAFVDKDGAGSSIVQIVEVGREPS